MQGQRALVQRAAVGSAGHEESGLLWYELTCSHPPVNPNSFPLPDKQLDLPQATLWMPTAGWTCLWGRWRGWVFIHQRSQRPASSLRTLVLGLGIGAPEPGLLQGLLGYSGPFAHLCKLYNQLGNSPLPAMLPTPELSHSVLSDSATK